ncbi:ABC transporter substrate-binding protein [Paenibacillus eucommiae]|uniref:Iron complex transport system substrate-binding protein n=1 Tax=Paenibacillus eucommiae TaxID=1355755 RepID=A0ABS4IVU4_9BACL|nr:iron-siderophore ABC transporter substrate-binding protein [Paenibacillus eucommiae]MBP1991695.1 iron complex transport system substrate-binding protein [Paenibacillus eucommiae]
MRLFKSSSITVVILSFILVLAACGSNKSGSGESSPPPSAKPSETASGNSNTSEGAFPLKITHAKGETVLDKPAIRVVGLEWIFSESLVALGIQPVGNADNVEYKTWVGAEAALSADVTDVGLRWEPDFEAIAALKPDLIISNTDNNSAHYDQLKAIAPTIEFDPYADEGDSYTRMIEIFNAIAAATGKTAEAEKVLSELEQHYTEAKTKLAAAGKADLNYVITQAFTYQNAVTVRMFTDTSTVSQTLSRIGLKNDWKTEKFEKYGFTNSTIEALPAVSDSNFIYIVQPDDDVFGEPLKNNSVWNGLNFVKEKRTYPIDGDTWTFGGPISSKSLVDRVVTSLTK